MTNNFENELAQRMQNVRKKADKRLRRIALAAYQRIVDVSPVAEGTFKANWIFSETTLDRNFDMNLKESDVQAMVSSASAAILSDAKIGNVLFICNSVPYALALEYGHSPKAPGGVVGPTNRIVAAAIRAGRL